MGQDYSYSQPSSSSNSVDITSLLEAEGQMYADEAESSYFNAEAIEYQPQPEKKRLRRVAENRSCQSYKAF
ncbi:hypothetical protein Bca4012_030838 [Brassica carinata]